MCDRYWIKIVVAMFIQNYISLSRDVNILSLLYSWMMQMVEMLRRISRKKKENLKFYERFVNDYNELESSFELF